jgi:hypothetical protein
MRGLVTGMLAFTLAAAAQTTEEHRHLPLPPWAFSALAFALFFVLFLAAWSFKSIGNRH